MIHATSKPNEYLVAARNGRIVNRGTAASVLSWPGTSFVRIPASKQEARFEISLGLLREELEVRRVENDVLALSAEGEVVGDRARQVLRRAMLPLEQAPAIAEALGKTFQGAKLSVYANDTKLLAPISLLIDLLSSRLNAGADGQARRAAD